MTARTAKKAPAKRKAVPKRKAAASAKPKPGAAKLLSGGNPQIAKADGDAPVQAYIAAMPDWKRGVGRSVDDLVNKHVPKVQKAVRWNSPMYGLAGRGFFLSIHCLTRYVRVTFFAGGSLKPIPPGGTPKSKEARWLDVYEDEPFDAAQLTRWIKQAAALPGWTT